VLRDLSTNGTFVNGATTRLAGEHVLRDGDRIEMGPYVVMVSGPPMPPRPQVVPPTVAPGARTASVMDTAPIRGGDPAAMLAAGGGAEAVRLTEILRVAKPREDSGVELTKIRMAAPAAAPARAAATPPSAPAPAPAPASPPAATQPAPPAPDLLLPTVIKPAASLLQALARGLGVEESALQGHDLLLLAEHLAAAAPPDKAAEARRRAASATPAPPAAR
jgi:predicted component of type VI protein secretion system